MARAVEVLRKAGMVSGLRKRATSFLDAGDVPLSTNLTDSGPKNLTNFTEFLQGTERIRSAVNGISGEGFLFALGGECSICVGTLAGLKSGMRGELGMVWVDAHGDFNTPETTPSGYIGGMCLALACGRGLKLNKIMPGAGRVLREENIIHAGSRSLDQAESENMLSSRMKIYPTSTLRKKGINPTVNSAVSVLADRCGWIICHLDVDALDPKIMAAVNFPAPDGLRIKETQAIVGAVKRTGKLKLLELAGYNPDLDPNRTCATRLVKLASELLV
jgi:arginase